LTPLPVSPYALSMNQGRRGRVLVTGATGYVAGHCISDLLTRGYDVRGTVRNLKTADMAHLRPAIEVASGAFDLAEATLDADDGWAEAASGCDYVLHVASPIPFKAPRHEDELIRPAVDGTTRVLTAAAKTGVKRVVCTSSLDVVTRNSATATRQRTEADWSDLAECNAYAKSKLLAEKKAWDLAADHGIELAVVHPGAIIGPPLQVKKESSADIVRRMLAGEMPAIPPLNLAFTDVRDLAAAHRLALEVPEAKGNRYICANGHLPMTGIAAILKEEYGPRGYKITTRPLPAWILRVAASFSSEAKLGVDMLGIKHDVTVEKAVRELGWTPRPVRESVLDTAESLISAGIVRPRKQASSQRALKADPYPERPVVLPQTETTVTANAGKAPPTPCGGPPGQDAGS
jgi:dihydroflavonol-4-reductase